MNYSTKVSENLHAATIPVYLQLIFMALFKIRKFLLIKLVSGYKPFVLEKKGKSKNWPLIGPSSGNCARKLAVNGAFDRPRKEL